MAVIHTLREGGDWSPNKLFSALWASFWSRAHPLDPPLSVVAVKSVVAIRASTTHTTVTRATALSGGFRGGARVACPPLFFDQNEARRAKKNFFGDCAPVISGYR